MAQIQVTDLTFYYEGSPDTVFEHVSFSIDTNWKLGLIGRNGKGKTTLLHLFMGHYEYLGSISGDTYFDYFPYEVTEDDMVSPASDLMEAWKPGVQLWQVLIQMNLLKMNEELLFRPFQTLSFGERTRIMLAVLFSGENEFLLIDEPTNHLDQRARDIIKEYLRSKKGFILVSHDRDLLDAVIDHVLVLNRSSIQTEAGNFSSWQENKARADAFAAAENEKHQSEITKLRAAADRSSRWADKNESTKIGYDPVKEHDRNIATRAYIGAKTKKMQSRVKNYEKRIGREIEEKEGLLKDIESVAELKLNPLQFHKEVLIRAKDLRLWYQDPEHPLVNGMTFEIRRGDRVFLAGPNGCGKSSLIHAILQVSGSDSASGLKISSEFNSAFGLKISSELNSTSGLKSSGELSSASGLKISYVSQDTSFLQGTIRDYCSLQRLDESLFFAVLRQLDVDRREFDRNMAELSEGQKKKVLIAASLITPAHLYIWDEPLNYIDVFSRMQIEKLILKYQPTMLLVEHDTRFRETIQTKMMQM